MKPLPVTSGDLFHAVEQIADAPAWNELKVQESKVTMQRLFRRVAHVRFVLREVAARARRSKFVASEFYLQAQKAIGHSYETARMIRDSSQDEILGHTDPLENRDEILQEI